MWENARDLEHVIRICLNLISFLLRELCLSYYLGEAVRGLDLDLNSEKKSSYKKWEAVQR